jgi:hypothetical protein
MVMDPRLLNLWPMNPKRKISESSPLTFHQSFADERFHRLVFAILSKEHYHLHKFKCMDIYLSLCD